jgi:hypothetical protein
MRDVDDRDATTAQTVDEREQPLDFLVRQGGRRLVEDEAAGVAEERSSDFDYLALGDPKVCHRAVEVELDTQLLENSSRLCSECPPADEAVPRRPLAEHHVFCNGEIRRRRELLEDHADPLPPGSDRVKGMVKLAGDLDRAGVRLVVAGKDLHERGLARPVLAKEGEHRAAGGVEVDSAEYLDATERLADPSCFESKEIRHVTPSISSAGSGNTC